MQFLTVTSFVAPLVFLLSAPAVVTLGHRHGGWGRVLLYGAGYTVAAYVLLIVARVMHSNELAAMVVGVDDPSAEAERAFMSDGANNLAIATFGWAPGLVYYTLWITVYAVFRLVVYAATRRTPA
ncbi:MAG: hypothetical protein AAF790_01680 [Planctomycetota bacterium]